MGGTHTLAEWNLAKKENAADVKRIASFSQDFLRNGREKMNRAGKKHQRECPSPEKHVLLLKLHLLISGFVKYDIMRDLCIIQVGEPPRIHQ